MRALVVDDEAAVQRLMVRGLTELGFECDTANDGNEALLRASKTHYDAVITDLHMPNKHGHALAVHLLTLEPRPVIVVHTGVVEPRIAADLLARGIDDILFKPCDFRLLATKVKALVDRKSTLINEVPNALETGQSAQGTRPAQADMRAESQDSERDVGRISLKEIESRLLSLSRILPISAAGLDVYNMTSTNECEIPEIAEAIQRDATLAAEVLRLANSPYYNRSAERILDLKRAVFHIGQKRIGEVALAANVLTALTANLVPWMNIGLTWKRSTAAGLVVGKLIDEGRYQLAAQGSLLCAIMHPLGRIALGTLFPRQYESMAEKCAITEDRLLEHERGMFEVNHAEAMALLTASWGIPEEIHLPLKFLLADDAALSKVSEPIRHKVELLRLAIYLGNVAVAGWEDWDTVDYPAPALLRKLDGNFIAEVVTHARDGVEKLAMLRQAGPGEFDSGRQATTPSELTYCDLARGTYDFLGEIISSTGIKLVSCSADDLKDCEGNVLVNCIGTPAQRLAVKGKRTPLQSLTIVTDVERVEKYLEHGKAIALPISYRRLHTICREASRVPRQAHEIVGPAFSKSA